MVLVIRREPNSNSTKIVTAMLLTASSLLLVYSMDGMMFTRYRFLNNVYIYLFEIYYSTLFNGIQLY